MGDLKNKKKHTHKFPHKPKVVGVESSHKYGDEENAEIVLATSIVSFKDETKASFYRGKFFKLNDVYSSVMVDCDDYKEYNILIGTQSYYEAIATTSYHCPTKVGVVPVFRLFYDYLTGKVQKYEIVDCGVQRVLSFEAGDPQFKKIDRSQKTRHPQFKFLKYYNSNAYEIFTGERGAHGIVKGRYFGVGHLLSDISSLFEVFYDVPPGNKYGDQLTTKDICEIIMALTTWNNLVELEWDGVFKNFVSQGRNARCFIVPSNILASQIKS